VIERRAKFDLDKAESRAHILEGLVKAQDRIDDIIAVGKASESREQFELILKGEESIIKGIKTFNFTAAQAKAIAERRLYQLSKLDVNKVKNEFDELQLKITDLREIIDSRLRRLNILLEEMEEMVEKHGDERRSFIDPMPLSMDREDLIEERAIAITLSEDNYIRHLPVESFRVQNRGGKGLRGVTTKDEDTPQLIVTCFSKDRLLIFTDQGRVYGLKAWETPQGSRLSRGGHIRNLLGSLRDDENIISLLPISKDLLEEPDGNYLIFATKNGRIKRSNLSEYVKINKNGKYAIKFAQGDNDSLISVRASKDTDHVVLVSAQGYACRFMPSEKKTRLDPNTGEEITTHTVRVQGRVSQGVSGMKLSRDDRVIGMIVSDNFENNVLTISKFGMAKRTRLGSGQMINQYDQNEQKIVDENGDEVYERDGYRKTNRGTKGVRTMSLNQDDEIISVRQIPNLSDQLFMLTKSGMMIRLAANQTKETVGKVAKGTRIMELRNKEKTGYNDEIIFVARLPSELIEENSDEESLNEEE
jgi:DNA gyrase subunit A